MTQKIMMTLTACTDMWRDVRKALMEEGHNAAGRKRVHDDCLLCGFVSILTDRLEQTQTPTRVDA